MSWTTPATWSPKPARWPTEIDTVQSSVTHTLASQRGKPRLTGTAAINGTGNTLANRLTGNAAANVLNGGAGADTMIGGLGNDTYIVDNAADVVTETSALATEIDTVQSSVTRTSGANLENLVLTGTAAINGTGNALANRLTGNAAANTLNGGMGNDVLNGGAAMTSCRRVTSRALRRGGNRHADRRHGQ